MNMRYRGLSYQSNPQVLETYETGVIAKFRGQTYQVSQPLLRASCPSPVILKYRGVAYIRGYAPLPQLPIVSQNSQINPAFN